MKISDSVNICDMQKQFSDMFPGLKIEFFAKAHEPYHANSCSDLISEDKALGELRNTLEEVELHLSSEMTVKSVENELKRIYGLNVQIFRKSVSGWLQTSTTDDWTLGKQNTKGLNSSNPKLNLYDRT